jgi:hypothetical protein
MNVMKRCRLASAGIFQTLRSFDSRLLESQAVARPLLCGLIRKVPIVVAGRAVDELADDVGMPGVPSDFCRDLHHDLLQGDLLPLGRPPPNSARRIECQRVDG